LDSTYFDYMDHFYSAFLSILEFVSTLSLYGSFTEENKYREYNNGTFIK